ncbi:zinc finger SWIM domain-containing 7 [Pyrrhoderma noxium]|uniref:Zinc finger SWIM domain-containing 7 n=1 Tax=Pyrrhoderma noxium TaxID=2282107 RepID=A0A286UHG3_9AGAM|nr:zinc finger SWIM domain-containing 7 [Pyrrhoderma noxium]
MPLWDLYNLLDAVINSIDADSGILSDEDIQKLQHVTSDNTLRAALDIIDHESVIHLKTYWGREYYEVHGSTSTYAIYIDLPSYMPVYCTCPAFSFSVLSSEDTIVCKHILAVKVALRLGRCRTRNVKEQDIAASSFVKYEN